MLKFDRAVSECVVLAYSNSEFSRKSLLRRIRVGLKSLRIFWYNLLCQKEPDGPLSSYY